MTSIKAITCREFTAYFATPLASVFIVIFLITSAAFTFFLGGFFDRAQADLYSFFQFHPWLYMVLIPAIAMRLWAEEIKSGTLELLLTLPVSIFHLVLGKFLAAWAFAGLTLVLTFPIWITVNVLGDPDNGAILAGYLGSWLMAGGFLSVGACLSAVTNNQVIAFILSVAACFILTASGTPIILDAFQGWAGDGLVQFISGLSFLNHYQNIMNGVLDFRDLVYFISLMAFFLFANGLAVLRLRKG